MVGGRVVGDAAVEKARGVSGPLSDQQERFALRYLVDFDRHAALTEAGYTFTTPESANTMASRLLNMVNVRAFLLEKKSELAAVYQMDAVRWLNHLRLIAMEAYEDKDWAGAVAALREIGKHLGVYGMDNRQKFYTPDQVDQMRAELEARGFDFTRRNAPATLTNDATPSG